jgi:hypothetical protein|tara:strand:- start:203 stop:343 length:141 start_codon:yes stop_codon:yes gene_type:complete
VDTAQNEPQTVYRYDAGRKGFKKAAIFLIGLSVVLAFFGIYWVTSF